MAKNLQRLRKIYSKTDGNCHICHRKLKFSNHGARGNNGAWHIEHSTPKAFGGSDHLNNLYAACIDCNMEKGVLSSRTIRNSYGNTRAPYSKAKKKQIKENNIVTGILVGGLVGRIGGPFGVMLGATIGGLIGAENSPRK